MDTFSFSSMLIARQYVEPNGLQFGWRSVLFELNFMQFLEQTQSNCPLHTSLPVPPYLISRRVRSSLSAPGVVLLRVRLTDSRSKSKTRLGDGARPLRIILFQTHLTYFRVSHVLDWAKRNMLLWFEIFSFKVTFLYNQKSNLDHNMNMKKD